VKTRKTVTTSSRKPLEDETSFLEVNLPFALKTEALEQFTSFVRDKHGDLLSDMGGTNDEENTFNEPEIGDTAEDVCQENITRALEDKGLAFKFKNWEDDQFPSQRFHLSDVRFLNERVSFLLDLKTNEIELHWALLGSNPKRLISHMNFTDFDYVSSFFKELIRLTSHGGYENVNTKFTTRGNPMYRFLKNQNCTTVSFSLKDFTITVFDGGEKILSNVDLKKFLQWSHAIIPAQSST